MAPRTLATAFLLTLLAACSKPPAPPPATTPTPAPSTAPVTLTIWDWHATDPSKPIGKWLAGIDQEFQAAHPGIKLNHVGQSHTEYYEILKATFSAADKATCPDVVMLHQGSRILDQEPSLIALTPYVTDDFRAARVGWDLTCKGYDPKGVPLAVPIAVQGIVWYYNKALLKQAGVDASKPPQTWDAFLAAIAKVKKLGKSGIAVGEKEGFWGEWWINSAWLQCLSDADAKALTAGTLKWTDPRVAPIFEKLKELNDKGCFQDGAMSTPLFPDAGEVFMRGDAAFFLGLISDVAHWKELGEIIGPENLGGMTCPVFKPGQGADRFPTGGAFAYAVTKWSQHPREAFDYIAFVGSDQHADSFLKDVGSFPANQHYDAKLMTDPNAKEIAGWMTAGRAGHQLTEAMPTAVSEALKRECQRILSGQTDVKGAMEAVEKVAEGERARAKGK
ncbi:MAG: extracellular solute-binding protein [Armatimonadetes bacterium]|nr:extracellular solute-binding protein [Armatimonadota bacterium]